MIKAGELRNKIVFQKPEFIKTEFGSEEETFTDILTTKCQIIKNKGEIKFNQFTGFHEKEISVVIRYRKEIDDSMEVLLLGNRYKIGYLFRNIHNNSLEIDLIRTYE